jgi:hypothetical protein
MKQRYITGRQDTFRLGKPDYQTRELLDRYVLAWETADVEGIISLLADGVAFPMPPLPYRIQGKLAVHKLISGTLLSGAAQDR